MSCGAERSAQVEIRVNDFPHLLQWLREALVLLSNFHHQLLILAVLLLHLCHILLQSLDQVQIVVSDVIVIVFDV